jgi:4,5-DOPA dioxygenase extradiol
VSPVATAAFVSHGAPTVALEKDEYTAALAAFGRAERPRAALVISAHWGTRGGVAVNTSARHRTMHDFGGFPQELYRIEYPAPGAPEVAEEALRLLGAAGFRAVAEHVRPLDHGVWVPALLAWPAVDLPIVQASLPDLPPEDLYRLGQALRPLREQGVLILGSGGLVHNLMELQWGAEDARPAPWAAQFDAWMAERLAAGDVASLLDYRDRAPQAARAAPTTEHLDPLFVVLGAAREGERPVTLFEGFQYGSLGLRSVALRAAA